MIFQILINNQTVNVSSNISILQACEFANILVPRFCYHERLSIGGNCRMCLVEINKAPKLVVSCAMPVLQNMIIHTNSISVKKAREGILEFLLVNHPLDCPICDQAGECDLQDQTIIFGSDRSRFREYKRGVQDKNCGPLIKTIMNRCIHCTRCIRFANEIIGISSIGTSGRGNSIEISLYIKKVLKSEFSGNLIDLCPVGALTSKPYTFITRPWELKSVQSIDTLDGIGCNIRIDIRGYEIMRILPRLNENINEEWISDKTRFGFDGLKIQRLYDPLLKQHNSLFKIISWQDAFQKIIKKLHNIQKPHHFCASIGPQSDLESIFLLKHLIAKKNGHFVNFEITHINNIDFQSSYIFNSTISKLKISDICVLLGINPRIDGSIVNLRLRKRFISGNFKVISFNSVLNLTFPVYNMGSTIKNLLLFIEGRHQFCKYFVKAKTPSIIIGQTFFEILGDKQTKLFINVLVKNTSVLQNNWNGINILSKSASDVATYELGIKIKPVKNLNIDFLYCIGESIFSRPAKNTFIVYQGHQGINQIKVANLILPGSAFTEKEATFINIEGRFQKTKLALLPPGNSKVDSNILYVIIDKLNYGFNYNATIFLYKKLLTIIPSIHRQHVVNSLFVTNNFELKLNTIFKNTFIPASKLENFYIADSITKSSITMVKCSKSLLSRMPFID